MKVKLILTGPERTMIVAALMAYRFELTVEGRDDHANEMAALAIRLGDAPMYDPADDGPEVAILSVERASTL